MPVHAVSLDETASGDKYVEVQVCRPGAQTGTDAYGEPTYENVVRMYLDEVPGTGWNQARIDAAVALMQSRLPAGLLVVEISENPGKAHINFTLRRVRP